ncbi:hypothetical protein H7J07_10625 [Mycobacterium koreense]|uniref:hypothetical protein n=1 Tax=Mycolicibacillus koreensis TaxID=1069220 RepID=UPI0013D594DA|nr:hypothetical protein [Mycolicibacillus koreensis]MCV7248666.1 hypothetical protein [Mycolicibacillus koreensis]
MAITAVLLTRGSGPATTSASGDDEPPITALSTSVLVDRSAFPIPGPHPQWQSMELDHAKEVIDPEDITGSSECKDLLYDTSYISGVFKRLAVEQPDAYIVLGVKLELGAKKYDVAEYVDKCANDRGAMNHGENTGAVRLSDLSGLPSWATAFSVEDSHAGETVFSQQSIVGYYREVKVSVDSACFGSGPSGVADDDLVGLFNDQVDKLAAAP